MEETPDTRWEQSLAQLAQRFDYPPTPTLTTTGHRRPTATVAARRRLSSADRRLVWGLAVLAVVALALLAVPQTRAALLSFFARVGAIEIFIDEAAPTAEPTPAPPPTTEPSTALTTAVGHSLALAALGEPTTLVDAARRVGFTPRVPAALGEPDEVYLHRDVDLPAVTLVWRGPDGAPLSLTQIAIAEFARKLVSEGSVEETTVGDAPALWLRGPHTLLLFGDRPPNPIPIASNVLIWAGDGTTYRLEGAVTLAEVVTIAESLEP